MMDEETGPSNVSPTLRRKMLRKEGDSFNFSVCCLFCEEEIDEEKEKNLRSIHSIEFEDSVLNICAECSDETRHAVSKRSSGIYNLVAEEARYHDEC